MDNDAVLLSLLEPRDAVTRDVLQKIDDVVSVKHPSRVALEKVGSSSIRGSRVEVFSIQEQLEYLSKIDDLYPRHQSQLEAANVRMLRDLQEEERLIAKRTAYVAFLYVSASWVFLLTRTFSGMQRLRLKRK